MVVRETEQEKRQIERERQTDRPTDSHRGRRSKIGSTFHLPRRQINKETDKPKERKRERVELQLITAKDPIL